MTGAIALFVLVSATDPAEVKKDIPYGHSTNAHKLQKLDLYLPSTPKKAPVFIYVHGGSWTAGDKAQVGNLPTFFTSKGWVLASINYRLSPEVKHPAHVQDVAKAVAWAKTNIASYGGDPNAIFFGGHSAGAHLVALLGTDERKLREEKISFDDIRGIVAWDTAAHDLPPIVRFNSDPNSPYRQAFGNDPAGWTDASPLSFAPKAKNAPPLMAVLAGGAGIQGKRASTMRLVDTLRGLSVRADFVDASSFRTHQSLMTEFAAQSDPVAPVVLDFLESLRDGRKSGVGKDHVLAIGSTQGKGSSDARLGDSKVSYLDPEFLQSGHLMTFADQAGVVWVARVNPKTGIPYKEDAREFKIAENLSKWSRYSNGPEWGEAKSGPALFFLLDDSGGKGQIWRASAPWDKPKLTQLTSDEALHHWIAMPSVDPAMPSIRMIAYRGTPGGTANKNVWIDEKDPSRVHPFGERMGIARFTFSSPMISWAPRQSKSGVAPQVQILDTASGEERVITDGEEKKVDPWLWNAPEFGGETLLAVNLDNRALGIYRNPSKNNLPWRKIAEIKLPSDAPHRFLKSIEPVNGGKGAFGRSYFTVQAGDDKDPDTSIWLFGFDVAGKHLVQRLDDGMSSGEKLRRLDPESLIGDDRLFVYYTVIGEGAPQLRLVRTGISKK